MNSQRLRQHEQGLYLVLCAWRGSSWGLMGLLSERVSGSVILALSLELSSFCWYVLSYSNVIFFCFYLTVFSFLYFIIS